MTYTHTIFWLFGWLDDINTHDCIVYICISNRWVLASLSMLDRVHWIDKGALQNFILEAQDERRGGISDRPDDETDVFHTFFGIAGL